MKPIPNNAIAVYLEADGYDDHHPCAFLKLIAEKSDGTREELWSSSWLDSHPDQTDFNMSVWRVEIDLAFAFYFMPYGVTTDRIIDFDKDCIWDWKFRFEFGTHYDV